MPDMFLKLDGIKGESTDDKHKDEIVIESFSFGEATNLNSDTGQRSRNVELQDFHFVMQTNLASAALMLACAKGDHIKEGNLTLRKPGAQPFEFLKIKFSDIIVSSFQVGGFDSDAIPTDQFSMWFAKIDLEYTRQSQTGGIGDTSRFTWDRIKGTP